MYSAIFESDSGQKYVFGVDGQTVFDLDVGQSVPVNLGTSQGFSQIGESVNTRSVRGRTIEVKGAVYGDIPSKKRAMRDIITPFASGRLVFNDQYYIRVVVKDPPSFNPGKSNGKFMLRFFAPYPFFSYLQEENQYIGVVIPAFRFPVNYSKPHTFGKRSADRYRNVYNGGNVPVPFQAHLSCNGTSTNPRLTNMKSLKVLKLNGTMSAGDVIDIYRDKNGALRVELTKSGKTSDIMSWVDDDSDLFELEVGDNLISALDDEDGASLTVRFTFSPAVGAVYET